jgi:hypothetical protein
MQPCKRMGVATVFVSSDSRRNRDGVAAGASTSSEIRLIVIFRWRGVQLKAPRHPMLRVHSAHSLLTRRRSVVIPSRLPSLPRAHSCTRTHPATSCVSELQISYALRHCAYAPRPQRSPDLRFLKALVCEDHCVRGVAATANINERIPLHRAKTRHLAPRASCVVGGRGVAGGIARQLHFRLNTQHHVQFTARAL